MTETGNGTRYGFAACVLDVERATLVHAGAEVKLRPRSFDVLRYLVEHRGRIVSKTELLDALWDGAVVTEDSVTQCVVEIRRALEDDAHEIVKTVPRRGYLFDASVAENPERAPDAAPRPGTWSLRRGTVAVTAVLLVAVVAALVRPGLGSEDARDGEHRGLTYDRPVGEVLDVQDETAAETSGTLEAPSAAFEAPQHVLQGRHYYGRRGPGDLLRGEAAYRRALELDPGYGPAWAGLASILRLRYYETRSAVSLDAYADAVERALEHGPDLAESHAGAAALARLRGDSDLQYAHLERALEMEPHNALVLSMLAGRAFGDARFDEAVDLQRRAAELDPLASVAHGNLGGYLLAAGRYEEAVDALRTARDLSSSAGTVDASGVLMDALLLAGRTDEVRAAIGSVPEGRQRTKLSALIAFRDGRHEEGAQALTQLLANGDVCSLISAAAIEAQRGGGDIAFEYLADAVGRLERAPRADATTACTEEILLGAYFRGLWADPRWPPIRAAARRIGHRPVEDDALALRIDRRGVGTQRA